jgi:hypothetical protein
MPGGGVTPEEEDEDSGGSCSGSGESDSKSLKCKLALQAAKPSFEMRNIYDIIKAATKAAD